jgi:hypothetical protein
MSAAAAKEQAEAARDFGEARNRVKSTSIEPTCES